MYNNSMTNNLFESSDEDEETYPLAKRRDTSDDKLWDSFEDPPDPLNSGSATSSKYLDASIKVLKIFTYGFVFAVILCSTVLSKMSFLFMTSHIRKSARISYCDHRQPQKQFEALIPDVQRIAWMWGLIFAYCTPELATFLRSIRICYFKSFRVATAPELILVLFCETLHVLGMGLLVFVVLPELDVIKGIMLTNCVCLVPAVLGLIAPASNEPRPFFKFILDIFAICAQLTGCVTWSLMYGTTELWLIPVAITLISFHWWENFISTKSSFSIINKIASLRENLSESRYYIYIFVAPFKMLGFLIFGIVYAGYGTSQFFSGYSAGWGNHTILVQEVQPILSENLPNFDTITKDLEKFTKFSSPNAILWVVLCQIICSYVAYIFAKFACKIHIQTFSFSFPVNLTVPIGVFGLLVICGLRQTDTCFYHNVLPDYMFFNMPPVYYITEFLVKEYAWIWLLWLISQTWITRHLWRPKSDKNASTEKLFISPWYNSLLIDQSLTLNRRRVDQEDFVKKINIKLAALDEEMPATKESEGTYDASSLGIQPFDKIPQVFICATMWHENKEEMMEFLKSILRLDEDQCARRMAKKYIQIDPNEIDHEYYDLETHIFFDDAFVDNKKKLETTEVSPLNDYVKLLIKNLENAALEVYKTKMRIYPPTKIVTPYGGRLVWTLPGRTKMIAHLKDKNKIRHKKRWSQVMYMYYLLGYRIMQMDCNPERKMMIAQNTYLMALDGDIDFQPKAVRLLIGRMKVDPDLGAACGRIHPVGSGPMVWYQVFEYAIGHWLQKATEHIIGCVLCSPGCFSLFRGRALMENSVMKKYTTTSNQARHYVQYDQGEDRWLCTLLLKQRFRVEYSAASDAYTHAPEGFNEFYNQRRRWVPSTMANIFDLLGDAKRIVKSNNSISMPYIFYQAFLMFGTVLGPGTIFLMMVGAVLAVFRIDIWTSFLWNFVPLSGFMVICYYCKQKYQLMAAFFISAVYSLVMMAVMVGIIIQVMDDGLMAPSSLFFFTVALQVIITGLLHPQEVYALPAGIVYYITIPSMYMLLVIYSLFNMNDVSWGTRENPPSADEPAATTNVGPETQAKQTRMQKMFGFLRPNMDNESGSLDVSFAGLFRCMFCTHSKISSEHEQLVSIAASLSDLSTKMKELEIKLTGDVNVMRDDDDDDKNCCSPSPTTKKELEIASSAVTEKVMASNYPPDWLYDTDLKNGDTESLSSTEEQFWIDLIERYLKPLELQQKDKDAIKDSLNGLRDMAIFAFVMANALFVLIVFLLQLHKADLHIRWPYNAKNSISYDESNNEIRISRVYLELEPIGLMFVFFFGLILLIQFFAMLMHRFTTISQILASTAIDWYCGKNVKEMSVDAEIRQNAVDLAYRLQKPKPIWDEDNLEEEEKTIGRRDTIRKILHQRKNNKDWSNLEANFERSFLRLNKKSFNVSGMISKEAFTLLDNRRKSQAQQIEKRQSMMADKKKKLQNNKQSPPPEYQTSNMSGDGSNRWRPTTFRGGVENFAFEPTEDEFEDDAGGLSPSAMTINSVVENDDPIQKNRGPRQSRVTFA